VALTASALKADQELFVSAGCTAYLTKPIKEAVLLQAIREHALVAPPAAAATPGPIIEVHVSPKIASLVPGFLKNCRRDVTAIRVALERDDLETVKKLGHSMRGAGGSYGFDTISVLGAALEDVSASRDNAALRQCVDELSRYLDQVQVVSVQSH
jgi:HPt (histidine-containing phosphotransfer) domain-containing protein